MRLSQVYGNIFKMYDVNCDRESRKIIHCYIIGLNKMTLSKDSVYEIMYLTLITNFVKFEPFIDAICVSFGFLRLSSKASIVGIYAVLLRKSFSNSEIYDIS